MTATDNAQQATDNTRAEIKDLLSCKIQIEKWEQEHFGSDCNQVAEIFIWREDGDKCHIMLSLDCLTVVKHEISQKAFDALSMGHSTDQFGNIESHTINQFVPMVAVPINELEYE